MSNQPLTVAVVVPCRNEVRHIEAVIRSILSQDCTGLQLEILIADGASTDGTREILDRITATHPQVRIIHNPAGYVSTGLNLAIAAARSEIIVRMDAHTSYAPDYIRQCVAALLETGADNVGGPARTQATTLIQRAIAAAYHSRFACGGARFHDISYEGYVDTVTYGCWYKSTLERLGLFDEALIRNQDDELNFRITRAGGKVWQTPKIVSWYHPRGSLAALFRQYFQYGFWKVAVIRKHGMPAAFRHLLPAAFVLSVLALSLGSLLMVSSRTRIAGEISAALLATAVIPYTIAAVCSAAFLIPRHGFLVSALSPLVFATYHVSYGSGFLRGLYYFRKRAVDLAPAGHAFTSLTR